MDGIDFNQHCAEVWGTHFFQPDIMSDKCEEKKGNVGNNRHMNVTRHFIYAQYFSFTVDATSNLTWTYLYACSFNN